MFHFIFDYNYGNSLKVFDNFVPLEAGMNTLPSRYKLCHFNLTTSPLYHVKLKIAQKPNTAVRSVEPIVPNFRRKSFNVRFFPYLLKILF